jgi:phospholipid-translocating ATPase
MLVLDQVSIDIPVNPIAYSAAFIFVIGVTGVKQGYEDWCRHQSDNKVNFADAYVLTQSGAMMVI